MNIAESLERAVNLQKQQILFNRQKEEQERVDRIRIEIATVCGYKNISSKE
jgi:hypothetical protein